ncbi:GntR family transcriptional regulator [Geobacillus proteiniphilus]|uniref:GntR family transcriptional regulator n=1 Tax=Geobacillus proteiniphilus TaxID=860353 RepID=A0ABY9ME36_9BACL|nr:MULTISPECIES: GntR family transcriptional regulator [Geobacillus]WMJ16249.1 GntR family transcriptional regulator [Geobacillus proteiniphilus]
MPLTRSEWVYEKLKEAILSGELAPGERLVVDHLARKLGTSSIPVRETLRRLEAEGWVERTPFVGARVAPIRLEEMEELFTIRLALEPILARTAVKNVSEKDITQLEELVKEMDILMKKNDAARYSQVNYQFHQLLYGLSSWKELYRIVNTVWEKSARSRWIFVQTPASMVESQKEHWMMIRALKEQNEEEMEKWMRIQKQRAFSDYLAKVKQSLETRE